jgi:hypothetical protein
MVEQMTNESRMNIAVLNKTKNDVHKVLEEIRYRKIEMNNMEDQTYGKQPEFQRKSMVGK